MGQLGRLRSMHAQPAQQFAPLVAARPAVPASSAIDRKCDGSLRELQNIASTTLFTIWTCKLQEKQLSCCSYQQSTLTIIFEANIRHAAANGQQRTSGTSCSSTCS